jgi:hypothetical protein
VPIAVGVAVPVGVIAIVGMVFLIWRRRGRNEKGGNGNAWQQNGQNSGRYYGEAAKPELDTQFAEVREMDGTAPEAGRRVHELS